LTINLTSGGGNEVTDGTNTLNWSSDVIENAIGGYGNDTITGNTADNQLTGGFGDDSLDGGAGNDTYQFSAGWGLDTITADTSGTDTVDFTGTTAALTIQLTSSGSDEVTDGANTVNWSSDVIENAMGGSGNDTVTGNSAANRLTGAGGNDTLDGGSGADTLLGGTGNDIYTVDNVGDVVTENAAEGTDLVQSSVTYTLSSDVENLTLTGSSNINGTGNTSDNILIGNTGNNTLDGNSGNDTYILANSWGIDSIADSAGTDTLDLSGTTTNLTVNLVSGAGDEVTDGTNTVNWSSDAIENLMGGSGNDSITGNSSANRLTGGSGNDTLTGGAGNDTYILANSWGIDSINDSAGTDTVDLSGSSANLTINLTAGASNEITDGTNTVNWSGNVIDNAIGGSGNDSILGSTGANSLFGGAGNDTLNGMDGNDTLDGGTGDDTYAFNNVWGVDMVAADASGNDTLDMRGVANVLLNINLTSSAGTEASYGTNTVNWDNDVIENAYGSNMDDIITGNSANNYLDGGSGSDSLTGGAGNDTLIGGSLGTDTLDGGAGNDSLDGGTNGDLYKFADGFGTDTISDVSGNDTLDFSALTTGFTLSAVSGSVIAGSDSISWNTATTALETILGGSGNDTITGNTASVNFIGNDGNDSLTGSSVADTLSGGNGNDSLSGGAGNDSLSGGAGNDTLIGGDGNDTLDGGTGDDSYVFSNVWAVDTITADSSGNDTLDMRSVANVALTINLTSGAGAEATYGTNTVNWDNDVIENAYGSNFDDIITGNSGANYLEGMSGQDSLVGGSGNDTLVGDDGNDTLIGGTGNDRLDGGTYGDYLDGGDGDDTYVFSASFGLDTITGDSSGRDTVDLSSYSTSLTINLTSGAGNEVSDGGTNTVNWTGDIIEEAVGGSGDDNITGNSGDNTLSGRVGNDTISGGSGNDSLVGGIGNDSLDGGSGDDFFIFGATSSIQDTNTWGNDTITDSSGFDQVAFTNVTASLTINLAAGAGNEVTDGTNTVNWTGDIIESAHGGSGNDSITGSSGDNQLSGHVGDDTLSGGLGSDSLTGGNGNDSLDGGSGDDYFIFGTTSSIQDTNTWGNDTITDSSGTEQIRFTNVTANLTINLTSGAGDEATDGTNTVNWSSDVIENVYSGSGNDSITGSSGANTLQGNGGNDTLNGQAGNDNLDGGAGDDTYQFSGTWGADTITADASGTDTVDLSTVTSNLTINLVSSAGNEISDGTNTVNWSSNIIERVLTGSGADTLTGGTGADYLSASSGNDSLVGAAGNDTLIGSLGNDTLSGGTGNDLYQFSEGDGLDTINENGDTGTNTDKILFDSSVTQSEVAIWMNGSNLEIGNTSASGDKITVQNQNTSGSTIERLELNSGYYLTDADINQVISDMTAYASAHSISLTSLNDVKNDANLMAIVNAGWHT
jgi:Ca2+-binding RTX toxin-like protein